MRQRMIEQINVRVSDDVYHRVRHIAAESGTTPSAMIRRILADHLNADLPVRMTTENKAEYQTENGN